MYFSVATVLAFASAVYAQVAGFHPITKPTQDEKVPAGSTYEIVWEPSPDHPGTVEIALLGGSSPQTLDVIQTIASDVDGADGSFNWRVDKSLGSLATYGIMITWNEDPEVFQYGFPFQITAAIENSTTTTSAIASETETETITISNTTSATTTTARTTSEPEPTTSSSTTTTTSSSSIITPTVRANISTSSTPTTSTLPQTTITTRVTSEEPTPTTTSTETPVPTNGVATVAASSFALFGGVAMAILAL